MTIGEAYDKVRADIKITLKEKRYIHSINVEKEAIKLAGFYNVNIEKCKLAAIAHDCAKYMTDEKLIKMCKHYNIPVDNIQRSFPQLLHGPVGAMYLKNELRIDDDEIINAVFYHTTGRCNMTTMEKIIYIADVIEEGRHFPGIDEIRSLVYTDLDKAILVSCNNTISYIVDRDLLIHPLTVILRNSILIKDGEKNE